MAARSAAGTSKAATFTTAYDLAGRVVAQDDPDSGHSTSVFDDAGDKTSSTDAKGDTVASTFDAGGRLTGQYAGSASGTRLTGFVYDTLQAGQQTSSTRYVGGKAYTTAVTGFDAAGRPTGSSVSLDVAGFAASYTSSQSWTSTGLLRSATIPAAGSQAGETISYGYDSLGQATTAKGASTYVAGSVLDRDMAVLERTFDTGSTVTYLNYGVDPQTRRVSSQILRAGATTELDATSYHYDLSGNVVRASDRQGGTGAPEQDTCYSYDRLDRLVQAWTATDLCAKDPSVSGSGTVGGAAPFWESWTFDAAGGRASQTAHQLPSTATPLSGSNPLTPTTGSNVTTYTSGSTGHAHALTGSTTTGPNTGSTTQSVDADGQVTSRSTAGGAQTIAWDELGQVSSVTTAAGRTSYVNDASGDPLVESDPSGATTLFLGSEDVTVTGSAVSKVVRYYSVGGAEVAYRVNGASPTYVEDDLQGTNRVAYTPSAAGTDPAAKVSRSFTDPYGNSLSATTASSLVSPVLATGRSFLNAPADGDTGLVSLGVRKYDPVTGSFLSVDPVAVTGDPGQLNGYAYGGGNPVTHADPSGAMYPSGGGSSGGSGMEDGPHAYGCRGNCGWSRADTRRYDARMAANRRYEAAAWRRQQARERAAAVRERRVESERSRERAAEAVYRLTHGGSRAYAPRLAPTPRPVFHLGTIHVTAKASDSSNWVSTAWHSSVHFVAKHKTGILIGVGAVALAATGVGLAADGGFLVGMGMSAGAAEAAGDTAAVVADGAGLTGAVFDTKDCLSGSTGSCLGAVGGIAGLGYGASAGLSGALAFTRDQRVVLDGWALGFGGLGFGSDFADWTRRGFEE